MFRLAIIFATLVIVILNIITIGSITTASSTYESAVEARTVMLEAEHMLSLLKDLEIGQRGYALSGDEEFLQPYRDAKSEIRISLAKLKNKVDGDVDLENKVAKISSILEKSVEDTKKGKFSKLEIVASTKAGKEIMDDLRVEFKQLEQEKLAIFQENRESLLRTFFLGHILVGINGFLAMVLIFLSIYHIGMMKSAS